MRKARVPPMATRLDYAGPEWHEPSRPSAIRQRARMRTALQQLLLDFLSAIVFLAVYALSDSVTLATTIAVAVGIAQFAVMKLTGRPIDAMQWLALGLVLVLGAATLITQDSRFIMVKPTVVHWAIGAVMLRHGWMTRYLPPIARDNLPLSVMVKAGYAWAALMFLLGALNLFVATTMSFAGVGLVHHLRRRRRQGCRVPRAVLDLPVDHPPQVALRAAGALAAGARQPPHDR